MKKYIVFLFFIHFLNGATTDKQVIVSPERPIPPTRHYVPTPYFVLVLSHPDYAEPMQAAYVNPNTMKYMSDGKTYSAEEVRRYFLGRAKEMQSIQNLKDFHWTIISHHGISGAISSWAEEEENTMEVARLLLPSLQGKGQGSALFEALFAYLPDQSWKVTSHPDNVASWKSQESAGFVLQKIEYVAEYKGPRKFYTRLSNNALEGREKVHFTYSGAEISLNDLGY